VKVGVSIIETFPDKQVSGKRANNKLVLTILLFMIAYICYMSRFKLHIKSSIFTRYFLVLDMRDSFTCSFTEFYPFTPALYYFSSFKDFKTISPA